MNHPFEGTTTESQSVLGVRPSTDFNEFLLRSRIQIQNLCDVCYTNASFAT